LTKIHHRTLALTGASAFYFDSTPATFYIDVRKSGVIMVELFTFLAPLVSIVRS